MSLFFKYLKSMLPKHTLIIALIFGLASFFTIFSGIQFLIPGTEAATDPREIFNAIGAAITGPIGGLIIAVLSTIVGSPSGLEFYVMVQHVITAVFIGWAYKRLVWYRYQMPLIIFAWIILIILYYTFAYLPAYIIVYLFFNEIWQQFVGGPLEFWSATLKLFYGWIPEIIFTLLYTIMILIALPPAYVKPRWGKEVVPVGKLNLSNPITKIYLRYFNKNFIPIRLSVLFLSLFLISLIYLSITTRNYFSDYTLDEEGYSQRELALQLAVQLDKMDTDAIPEFVKLLNGKAKRTVKILDNNLYPLEYSDGKNENEEYALNNKEKELIANSK